MWLSGTEVNIDFQSSIIDPSKKKLSNFEKELATHSSVLAWLPASSLLSIAVPGSSDLN